jgi:localization factor PodJL
MKTKAVFAVAIATSCIVCPVGRADIPSEHQALPAAKHAKPSGAKSRIDIRELKDQAIAGNPQAQFALAKMYEIGAGGLPKSLAYALSWYEEAARNGHRIAIRKIASLAREDER